MALTLEDLIRRFRTLSDDKVEPYLSDTDDVVDWLNDAQAQACVRGRLLVAEGDPSLCQIALQPGKSIYALNRALYELIDLRIKSPDGHVRPLALKSREWLEAEVPAWREDPRPCAMAVQTDTGLRLVGKIEAGELLHLEAYRLPLKQLRSNGDKPEIHDAHHEHLVYWALHRAFSVPDSDLFDPNRSVMAEKAFSDYFGLMPDSDMRRITREDVVHFNKAIFP